MTAHQKGRNGFLEGYKKVIRQEKAEMKAGVLSKLQQQYCLTDSLRNIGDEASFETLALCFDEEHTTLRDIEGIVSGASRGKQTVWTGQ